MLQDRYRAGSAAARRFVDEARITGQLQHPAIPPVHELGTLPDGRPFLAMKLIKGDTLADLLRRPEPGATAGGSWPSSSRSARRSAYAHAARVIHRDLKPANVMVGAFGEVQVMDWGLAKVLGEAAGPSAASRTPTSRRRRPTIRVAARPGRVVRRRPGSVLGTPAYMPPEQAGGASWTRWTSGSDVFGLGAVLCADPDRPAAVPRREAAETVRLMAVRGTAGRRLRPAGRVRGRPGAGRPVQAVPERRPGPTGRPTPARWRRRWPTCGRRPTSGPGRPNWTACGPRASGRRRSSQAAEQRKRKHSRARSRGEPRGTRRPGRGRGMYVQKERADRDRAEAQRRRRKKPSASRPSSRSARGSASRAS